MNLRYDSYYYYTPLLVPENSDTITCNENGNL